jgi:hypothetical protein
MNKADVGVLFVHGIGEQQRADTLVQFGEALKGWLERWLPVDGARVKVDITHADLNQTAGEVPAHAKLRVTAPGIDSTWVLAESWWAASFQSPRYSDLWRWSLEIVPLAVADHFVRRIRLAFGHSRIFVELALASVAIACLPIMTLVMMASLVIGILPIPRLRKAILRLQKLLLGTVGDSYALLESSIRGAAMSSRVQHDLRWLKDSVNKTVIVAHSQGAAVAHAALQASDTVQPDLFFTFGSGLRKLLVLDVVRGGNRFMIWLLSFGLLLVSFGSWRIYRLIVDPTLRVSWFDVQGIDPRQFYGFDLTNLLGADLTDFRWLTALGALAGGLTGLSAGSGSLANRVKVAAPIAAGWGATGLLMEPFMVSGPPGGLALGLVVFGLLAFTFGLTSLAEKDSDTRIEQRLKLKYPVPWVDRYALADPVPNGPLVSGAASFVSSRPVTNFGSPLLDHSAYWRNQDQFVTAVAFSIAAVAGLDLAVTSWDANRVRWAEARRKWRVAWLMVSRVLAVVVAVSLLVRFREGLWRQPSDMPPVVGTLFSELIDLIDNIPFLRLLSNDRTQTGVIQLVWLASMFFCVWIVYRLFAAVWSWWDRAETRVLFHRRDYTLLPLPFATLIAVLTTAVMVSVVFSWFLDRPLADMVSRDASIRAILQNGWKGFYQPLAGLYTAVLLALMASGLVGIAAKSARDSWLWGRATSDNLETLRGATGYGLLALTVIAPLALWMAGAGDTEARTVSQSRVYFMSAGAAIPGLILVALWCIALDTPTGRRAVERLHHISASGPLGRWLARDTEDWPSSRLQRVLDRAQQVLAEWNEIKKPSLETQRDFSAEASALAHTLAQESGDGERQTLLSLTDTFPHAALAASETLAATDAAIARRILEAHRASSAPSVRRRVRRLLLVIGEPEPETLST